MIVDKISESVVKSLNFSNGGIMAESIIYCTILGLARVDQQCHIILQEPTHSANPAAKHSDRLVLAVQRHQPLQLAGALPSRGLVLVEALVDPRRAPEEADAAVPAPFKMSHKSHRLK